VRAITPTEIAAFVETLHNDRVVIEGAGGLLVPFGDGTIADVARLLDAPMLVVARAGLGTLNHTALTVEAIERRGLRCLGIVIGSWPREPDLASLTNLDDLEQIAPVLGRLPEGVEHPTLELPA
jgi:dethiobiotin synthetase